MFAENQDIHQIFYILMILLCALLYFALKWRNLAFNLWLGCAISMVIPGLAFPAGEDVLPASIFQFLEGYGLLLRLIVFLVSSTILIAIKFEAPRKSD